MREKTNRQVALQAILYIFKYSAPNPRSFIPTILRCNILLLRIKEWNKQFVFIFMCPNTVLTYSCLYYRLYVVYFTWLHQLRQLPASPHGEDCSGRRIEEIPGGSSCFLFFSDDFYFARLPEDEQLMVLPVMLKSLRMSGVGECHFGVRLPENSDVLQMRRRFAGFYRV